MEHLEGTVTASKYEKEQNWVYKTSELHFIGRAPHSFKIKIIMDFSLPQLHKP